MEDKIDHGVYTRQHSVVQAEIDGINQRITDIEDNRALDLNLIEEVLNMTRNIYKTYQNSPDFMKQHYLRFFFERIEIKHQKVSKYIATPTFQTLLECQKVLKSDAWLLKPCDIIDELNIKKILKSFQNVAHIGVLRQRWEEIKKLTKEPNLALSTS